MSAAKQAIALPDELKLRLKSFVTERSGLYFKDHDLKGLEDALVGRIVDEILDMMSKENGKAK